MAKAEDSPFAARMMAKPLPESLNSDPAARFFFDPPELIQQAFGGRQWFLDNNCYRVHRVGIFKGLGWEIDPAARDEREITGVRITRGVRGAYAIEFLHRSLPGDWSEPVGERHIDVRVGLRLDQLKGVYLSVIGKPLC